VTFCPGGRFEPYLIDMARGRGMSLADSTLLGLFFIQRYHFLTIEQFARAAGIKRAAASDQLRAPRFMQTPT
jgi:hypothetical protein